MAQVDDQDQVATPVAFGDTITVLFTDIRGFTEFTDLHGDEAGYRMLQNHNSLVTEQIELRGGHIVKGLGDSFMVSFGSARTSILCAQAIQGALAAYNRGQGGPQIQIGIGINTGEPVREAGDLFGGSVNLASRICAAAGPGEILVSETVRRVVGHPEGAEWVDRGLMELKGFREPQHLFELNWSPQSPRAGSPHPATEGVLEPRSPAPPSRGTEATVPPSWLRLVLAGIVLLVAAGTGLAFLIVGRSLPSTSSPAEAGGGTFPVRAADAQPAARPPMTMRTLVASESVGALVPPVCVRMSRATVAGGEGRPPAGYHTHDSLLVYQVDSAHRLEFPDGASATLAPGEASFVSAQTPHRHVNPTGTLGTELLMGLTCARTGGAGTVLIVSDPLPGVRSVPTETTLIEIRGAPGSQTRRQQAAGPVALYVLEGTLAVSTGAGMTEHAAGQITGVPPAVPFQVSVGGGSSARALVVVLAPTGEPPVQEVPG